MELLGELTVQIIFLIIIGALTSFIIWKIKGGKKDFGEFLNKYSEMMAYVGLFIIISVIALIQWLT
jgi:hypothetical protein